MAEQIKSFWTHLCAMIGAIFSILIGGTAVTIKSANAAGCEPSGWGTVEDIGKKVTLDNGAVVDYLYGWFSTKWKTYSGSEGNCLQPDSTATRSRYYVYFRGCADGFYSTQRLNTSTYLTLPAASPDTTIGCVSSTAQTLESLSTPTTSTVCSLKYPLCEASGNGSYRPAGHLSASYCRGASYTNAAGNKVSYFADPEELTDGLCKPCPPFEDYKVTAGHETFSPITGCYVSKTENYTDDTGTFHWEGNCKLTN